MAGSDERMKTSDNEFTFLNFSSWPNLKGVVRYGGANAPERRWGPDVLTHMLLSQLLDTVLCLALLCRC